MASKSTTNKSRSTKAARTADARAKVAAARIEAERKARRGKVVFRGSLALLLAGGVAAVAAVVVAQQDAGKISGVKSYANLSRNHVSGTVNYPQTPPVGGDHNPVPQNCGIYTSPVTNENAVHSMEHGAVWVTYQPGIGAAQIATLTADVQGKPYTLLSPYPTEPSPITVTAWGKQLTVNSASDARIAKFIKTYAAGPQTPEPGAPCSGGVGTPNG